MKTAMCALIVMVVLSCQAEMTTSKNITTHMFKHSFKYLRTLISKVKDNNISFHSPASDIQCCDESALECFNKQLMQLNTSAKDLQIKLHKNLKKTIIIKNVDPCTREQKENVQCQSCDSFPKLSSKEFLNNLQTLLQKIFSRLV